VFHSNNIYIYVERIQPRCNYCSISTCNHHYLGPTCFSYDWRFYIELERGSTISKTPKLKPGFSNMDYFKRVLSIFWKFIFKDLLLNIKIHRIELQGYRLTICPTIQQTTLTSRQTELTRYSCFWTLAQRHFWLGTANYAILNSKKVAI